MSARVLTRDVVCMDCAAIVANGDASSLTAERAFTLGRKHAEFYRRSTNDHLDFVNISWHVGDGDPGQSNLGCIMCDNELWGDRLILVTMGAPREGGNPFNGRDRLDGTLVTDQWSDLGVIGAEGKMAFYVLHGDHGRTIFDLTHAQARAIQRLIRGAFEQPGQPFIENLYKGE